MGFSTTYNILSREKIRLEKNRIIYFTILPHQMMLYTLKSEASVKKIRYEDNHWNFVFNDDTYKYVIRVDPVESTAIALTYEKQWLCEDKLIDIIYDLNVLDKDDTRVFIGMANSDQKSS